MLEPDEIRYTTTDRLADDAIFVDDTRVTQSTRGPICPSCNQLCSMVDLDEKGVGDCPRCPATFGFMAVPNVEGCLWTTWYIEVEDEGGDR